MPTTIPNTPEGSPIAAAIAAIFADPLLVFQNIVDETHGTVPAGMFIDYDPTRTTAVPDNQPVRVRRSLGPTITPPPPGTVEVIPLIGHYSDELGILQWALDNAVTLNTTLVDHPTYDHGLIIGANLLPPAHVAKDGTGTINITVVKPAPTPTAPTGTLVRLPNGRVGRPRPWTPETVRGMTKDVGLAQLTTNGIDFDVEEYTDESLMADNVIQTIVLDPHTGRYRVRVGRWPWLKRFWDKR